jgi:cyclase
MTLCSDWITRNKNWKIASIFLSLIFCIGSRGYDDKQRPHLDIKEIKPDIYLINFTQNISVNALLVIDPEGAILFDSGLASLSERLGQEINKLTPNGVKFIVSTHPHWDHFMGNIYFGKNSTIIAQRMALAEYQKYGLATQAIPTVLIDESEKMTLGQTQTEIVHVPMCHSKGDIVAYLPEENILITGDLFFPDAFPLIPVSEGSSLLVYRETLRLIEESIPDDVIIIPGHGNIMSKNDLINHNKMIDGTIEEVRALIDEGRSYNRIHSKSTLSSWAEYYTNYSPSHSHRTQWINAIYLTYFEK